MCLVELRAAFSRVERRFGRVQYAKAQKNYL